MNDTFMKEKPVLPLILSMSLPMVLSMLVNSSMSVEEKGPGGTTRPIRSEPPLMNPIRAFAE